MIRLKIEGDVREVPEGTTYEQIAEQYQGHYDARIAAVSINGKIKELFKRAKRDGELTFFTYKDNIGAKTYERTAVMIFMKALTDVAGEELARGARVEFKIGPAICISLGGSIRVTPDLAASVLARMRELCDMAMPLMKSTYPLDDAVEIFHRHGQTSKEQLFRYRRSSTVNVYEMDGYSDYYYGYMLPNAGYVQVYNLIELEGRFALILPDKKAPDILPKPPAGGLLYETLQAAEDWGQSVGISNVGELNGQICSGGIEDAILVQEAWQERRIAEIAADIASRGNVKFVMIAGPSSSGKTTFSHRLSIQLRTLGLRPHPIGLDDYYKDRSLCPVDADGHYDFESLDAIDVPQFNEDCTKLLAGERVELPHFNFKTGLREYNGDFLQLGTGDILVIEGIHGLNPRTSHALPDDSKYKIYISALTSLNIDDHNRIPTTDVRLLRRIVRDARTRGASARMTISMWPSVRRGEEANIFPYQEEADAMFNSALIYELSLLKQYAEPLLFDINRGEPEYHEAKRLLKFLDYFLGASAETLPNNSICREFVGGSCFRV